MNFLPLLMTIKGPTFPKDAMDRNTFKREINNNYCLWEENTEEAVNTPKEWIKAVRDNIELYNQNHESTNKEEIIGWIWKCFVMKNRLATIQ